MDSLEDSAMLTCLISVCTRGTLICSGFSVHGAFDQFVEFLHVFFVHSFALICLYLHFCVSQSLYFNTNL